MRLILASYDYNKTITILVGPKERSFVGHQDILCASSKFFRAACSKRWLEGQEKMLRLPEVRSEAAFQTYANWTYTNELVVAEPEASNEGRLYDTLIETCLLGDFLGDVKFRNDALRSLNTHTIEAEFLLCTRNYRHIWNHTPPNSLLRAWTVDAFISLSHLDDLSENAELYPTEFVLAVAIQAVGRIRTKYIDVKGFKERFASYLEPGSDA